ncbi:MAG: SdpI family protein [Flavisolibacter sp.]
MKKNILISIIVLLVSLFPLVYQAMVWSNIPDTIVLHYNEKFQPDRIEDKSELWIITTILSAVSILCYLLLAFIPRPSSKTETKESSDAFIKMAAGIAFFITALNVLIITSTFKTGLALEKFLFPLIGLLFAYMGYYMNKIQRNYFAGFRLPWTMKDEDNWEKTHQLASRIWLGGGIFITIISLMIPSEFILPIFIVLTLILVIIPSVYSYKLFKTKAETDN